MPGPPVATLAWLAVSAGAVWPEGWAVACAAASAGLWGWSA